MAKYKETNDNIMSFVYDWFSAKRIFSTTNLLTILNLGIQFYNTAENDNDVLVLDNKKEILLREGSSGLQSIIPLIVIIEYLTTYIYNNNVSNSVEEKDSLKTFLLNNIIKIFDLSKFKNVDDIKSFDLNDEYIKKLNNSYQRLRYLESYFSTNFIIEEPEQNLFPSTQRDLINYLFSKMNDERDHTLLLTTHSPYVLYSINNNIMGCNVKDKINDEKEEEVLHKKSWFNPDLVSIWQVQEGKLVSVKDEFNLSDVYLLTYDEIIDSKKRELERIMNNRIFFH